MMMRCNKLTIAGTFGSLLLIYFLYSFMGYEEKDLLVIHCDDINADITRPDDRMCVKGLSLSDDGTFKFKTRSGKTEVYLVTLSESEGKDTPVYNYAYENTLP